MTPHENPILQAMTADYQVLPTPLLDAGGSTEFRGTGLLLEVLGQLQEAVTHRGDGNVLHFETVDGQTLSVAGEPDAIEALDVAHALLDRLYPVRRITRCGSDVERGSAGQALRDPALDPQHVLQYRRRVYKQLGALAKRGFQFGIPGHPQRFEATHDSGDVYLWERRLRLHTDILPDDARRLGAAAQRRLEDSQRVARLARELRARIDDPERPNPSDRELTVALSRMAELEAGGDPSGASSIRAAGLRLALNLERAAEAVGEDIPAAPAVESWSRGLTTGYALLRTHAADGAALVSMADGSPPAWVAPLAAADGTARERLVELDLREAERHALTQPAHGGAEVTTGVLDIHGDFVMVAVAVEECGATPAAPAVPQPGFC